MTRHGSDRQPPKVRSCGAVDHAALLQRLCEGDRRALDDLIARFDPLVRATARRICRVDDLDDVVQEVWLTLLRRCGSIRSPGCLPGWLQQVARNTALANVGRREMPTWPLDDGRAIVEQTGLDPFDHLIAESRRRAVREAVGRLCPDDRHLLALLMTSDRPDYQAVSVLVARPIGSLGPTRGRILRRLSRDPAISGWRER